MRLTGIAEVSPWQGRHVVVFLPEGRDSEEIERVTSEQYEAGPAPPFREPYEEYRHRDSVP